MTVGLVLGKPLGIGAFAWIAIRAGVAAKPDCAWPQLIGVAALAGIGFTVSLFVTGLAFDGELASEATLGVLVASVVASIVGVVVIISSARVATVDGGQPQHAQGR